MARSLRFADAVELLGGKDSKFLRALEKTAGWLMAVAAPGPIDVLAWFDLKSDLARLSQEAVRDFYEKRSGLARYGRAERIEAAHTVIVIAAFFEGLAEVRLPVELKKSEAVALGAGVAAIPGDFVNQIMSAAQLVPAVTQSPDDFRDGLHAYYAGLVAAVNRFFDGLAATEALSDAERDQITELLAAVAGRSLARYDDSFLELAKAFPEVRYWAQRQEHRAIRAALAGLSAAFHSIYAGPDPDERRAGISAAHSADLRSAVTDAGKPPADLRVPTLDELYVPHRFRVMREPGRDMVGDEDQWAQCAARDDLRDFLVGHLTSPPAARAPLYVVGAAGSGKSAFTRVLAAHLPAAEFLVLRVELRDVEKVDSIQGLIEQAVLTATGDKVDWPDLVRSVKGVVPVVIFDAFDELLQVTGLNQGGYLESVAKFQRRELNQNRSVAVVVTSRTAVASQAEIPEETVAIRLEPFDDEQIAAWLDGWNRVNTTAPLTPEQVRASSALARQPLLLTMLAVHAAGGGPARDLDPHLLHALVTREVAKYRPGMDARDLRIDINTDLRTLTQVALAMFDRGGHSITEGDLELDTTTPVTSRRPVQPSLRPPLRSSDLVFGRFPFLRHGARYSMHGAFADHLVGQRIWSAVEGLRARDSAPAFAVEPVRYDDQLRELLSVQVLSLRPPVMDVLGVLAAGPLPGPGGAVQHLLVRLFRALDELEQATYRANLLLLALCGTSGTVLASELFGDRADVVGEWRAQTLIWESRLSSAAWHSLVSGLTVDRVWTDIGRDVRIGLDRGGWSPAPVDPAWAFHPDPENFAGSTGGDVWRRANFRCDRLDDLVAHTVEPILREFGTGPDRLAAAKALLEVCTDPSPESYDRCVRAAISGDWPPGARLRFVDLLIRQLGAAGETAPEQAAGVLTRLHEALPHDLTPPIRTRMVMCALTHLDRGPSDALVAGALHALLRPDLGGVETVTAAYALVRLAELGLPLPPVRQLRSREHFDALVGEVANQRPGLAERLAPLAPPAPDADGKAG